MNFATFAVLVLAGKESWADAAERNDTTLPPLPLHLRFSAKVITEPEWNKVERKKKKTRGINNTYLGCRM